MSAEQPNEGEEPLVNDKRRIDPETGQLRGHEHGAEEPAQDAATDEPGEGQSPVIGDAELADLLARASAPDAGTQSSDEPVSADAELAEQRLQDLQRISAEYANYRRRTEQERAAAKEANTAEVLRALLPVLDDLDRAEQHGDLPEDSPVAVIAAKLRGALTKLGLAPYGEVGEAFDPQCHEAIAQLPKPDAEGETIADVVERGYTVGERIVRVAKVAVFVPAS